MPSTCRYFFKDIAVKVLRNLKCAEFFPLSPLHEGSCLHSLYSNLQGQKKFEKFKPLLCSKALPVSVLSDLFLKNVK